MISSDVSMGTSSFSKRDEKRKDLFSIEKIIIKKG
jgi:hypothetical protein